MLVEAVRLFRGSEGHPAEFETLLAELNIKVNTGEYVVYRRVIAVLFASITKGEGSLADGHISRSQLSRYTRALARAVALAGETPLDALAEKIEGLGGYYQLWQLEVQMRKHHARTDCTAPALFNDTPAEPAGQMKLKSQTSRPVLMLVYPDGKAYKVSAPAETVERYAREIGRAA